MPVTTVTLGDHTLPIFAQRHARLRHELSSADVQRLTSGSYGREAYRLLAVFVPGLSEKMPEHEFEGYASEEAMRDGRYDPEADRSPTTAEIAAAFKAVLNVSFDTEIKDFFGFVHMLTSLALKSGVTPQATNGKPTPTPLVSPGVTGE